MKAFFDYTFLSISLHSYYCSFSSIISHNPPLLIYTSLHSILIQFTFIFYYSLHSLFLPPHFIPPHPHQNSADSSLSPFSILKHLSLSLSLNLTLLTIACILHILHYLTQFLSLHYMTTPHHKHHHH